MEDFWARVWYSLFVVKDTGDPRYNKILDLWKEAFGMSFEKSLYDTRPGPLEDLAVDRTALAALFLLL